MVDGVLCKMYKCDICGKMEIKEHKGTKELDGGFTKINEFESTTFCKWCIDDRWYLLCPDCKSYCIKVFNEAQDKIKAIDEHKGV